MAKNKSRRQDVNPVSDPKSEELRQRILESQYQMQLEEEGQRLKQIQEQAENNLFTSWEMVMASRSSEAVDIWEKGFVELFLGKITLENLCEQLASVIR